MWSQNMISGWRRFVHRCRLLTVKWIFTFFSRLSDALEANHVRRIVNIDIERGSEREESARANVWSWIRCTTIDIPLSPLGRKKLCESSMAGNLKGKRPAPVSSVESQTLAPIQKF